jgi:aspartyl-tRNA(Asn)/glutamyl-tRNA(Gln) amidotransferase subunit C
MATLLRWISGAIECSFLDKFSGILKVMSSPLSSAQVKHVAKLANIPVDDKELSKLATAFTETLAVIENLQQPDTSNTMPTHQVTGMENVTRPDTIDKPRMFTQEQALANASQTHQGYFVVPAVLENKD